MISKETEVSFDVVLFLIEELMSAGRIAAKEFGGKSSEPIFTLRWHKDGSFSGTFYSYALDLKDGGRHHFIEAKDLTDLINNLWKLVDSAREEIKDVKG